MLEVSRDLGIESLFHTFFSFLARSIGPSSDGAAFFPLDEKAGEHRTLIVLIRAISTAREPLSSGVRVTITVPAGSKWWIEHAGVTTFPLLKRAPSHRVEEAIIDGGKGWGEDYRDYKKVVVLTERVYSADIRKRGGMVVREDCF